MEIERVSQAAGAPATATLSGMEPLVLASASPRRAEILRAVGWPFEVVPADVDETLKAGESPEEFVRRLARAKAEAIASASHARRRYDGRRGW
jgi:predicted house-cleaning NTP pyrophosphatase (Maf/HAM1 superfamily)